MLLRGLTESSGELLAVLFTDSNWLQRKMDAPTPSEHDLAGI